MARQENNDFGDFLRKQDDRKPVKCPVARFLRSDKTDPGLRSGVEKALATESIYGTTIAEVLSENGCPISGVAVQRHRRGACGCGRNSE